MSENQKVAVVLRRRSSCWSNEEGAMYYHSSQQLTQLLEEFLKSVSDEHGCVTTIHK